MIFLFMKNKFKKLKLNQSDAYQLKITINDEVNT